jgi:hypothetical protein
MLLQEVRRGDIDVVYTTEPPRGGQKDTDTLIRKLSEGIGLGLGNPTSLLLGSRGAQHRRNLFCKGTVRADACEPAGSGGEQTTVLEGAGRGLAGNDHCGCREWRVSCPIRRRKVATTAPTGRRRIRVMVVPGPPSVVRHRPAGLPRRGARARRRSGAARRVHRIPLHTFHNP